MKKRLFISLLILFCGCVQEQLLKVETTKDNSLLTKTNVQTAYYYSSIGSKIYITEKADCKYVVFDNSIMDEFSSPIQLSYFLGCDLANIQYCYFPLDTEAIKFRCICATVNDNVVSAYEDYVLYSAPYYNTSDQSEVGVSNIFRIKLKAPDDYDVLSSFAEENEAYIIKECMVPLWYSLSCTSNSEYNALELANLAYETGLFDIVDVEFIDNIQIESNTYEYNDPLYPYQWNLKCSEDFGIGIDNVHFITTGDSLIVVSIIDNGINIYHPELNILNSWDATSGNSPAVQYIYSEDYVNYHGTATAGLVGARINNNRDVVGVAPNVSLLPISVQFGKASSTPNTKTTSEALGDALIYAANNGADVISNSWSMKTDQPYINSAISSAISSGRNGKGSVVVFASGNQSQSTSRYPHASNLEIISVGNTDSTGFRKSTSNYGPDLDVVAPGTMVYILDGLGSTIQRSGTSYSCPQVAAIAGLMLSVNPDLTYSQVSEIIDKTAGRISTYSFIHNDDKPHGLWNEEVGYGLVNAMDAVSLAKGYYNLISFDYMGQMPEVSITADKDISVIWDWETSDIEDLETTSLTTFNLTHTYSTSKKRRIYIAEKVDFVTDTIPTYSTAIRRFDLSKGGYVSDIDIKPVNSALEYVRIIGGASFPTQTISVSDLPALKELYIVNAKNASVTVDDCPELTKFGSSRYIWGAPMGGIVINPLGMSGDSLDPNVVGDPEWPSIPEPVVSFSSLSITSCPKLHTLSLENVGLQALNLTQFPNLKYLYLTSGSTKIVGGGSNLMNPSTYGVYLKNAIQTLPSRNGTTTGKVLLRCVSSNNSSYIPVTLGTSNYNMIMSDASSKNWNIVWDSGVNY